MHQQDDRQKIDVVSLKSSLLSELYTKSQLVIEKKDQEILQLQNQLNALRIAQEHMKSMPAELRVLFPQIADVWVSQAIDWQQATGLPQENMLLINVTATQVITQVERIKLEAWLAARLHGLRLKLVIELMPSASKELASNAVKAASYKKTVK